MRWKGGEGRVGSELEGGEVVENHHGFAGFRLGREG